MIKKYLLSFVFLSALLFAASPAFAAGNSGCLVRTIAGAYINTDEQIMRQWVFNEDGTAYFNESNAISLPITTGTFIPAVGTWEIVDDRVVATVISTFAAPTVVNGINDVTPELYLRLTWEFKIIDDSTIQSVHVVEREFKLDKNPLTSPGTVFADSTAKHTFTKVKVRVKDLK